MEIKSYLDKLGISFKVISHPPLYTCADAEKYRNMLNSPNLKNLFLKSKNKSEKKYYLVILYAGEKLDIKRLESVLNDKVTFAKDDELKEVLNLIPGSVSPFGLINDSEKLVDLIIEQGILSNEYLSFHPNTSTETLELTTKDFLKYLDSLSINARLN